MNSNTGEINWENNTYSYSDTEINLIDDIIIATVYKNSIYELSVLDGSIMAKHPMPVDENGITLDISSMALFKNGNSYKIFFTSCIDVMDSYIVGVYDLSTDEYILSDDVYNIIYDICIIDDSSIAIASKEYDPFFTNYSMYSMKVLGTSTLDITLLDINTVDKKWENTLDYTQVAWNEDKLMPFTYIDENNISHKTVVGYNANIVNIYSLEDGSVLTSYNVNEPLVYISDNENGQLQFITNDGYWGTSSIDDGIPTASFMKYFTEDIDTTIINRGVYIHKSGSSEIMLYVSQQYDDEITYMEDSPSNTVAESYISENYLITLTYDENYYPTVMIYDLDSKKKVFENVLSDEYTYSKFKILGEDNGKVIIAFNDEYIESKTYLYLIDVANNSMNIVPVNGEEQPNNFDYCSYKNGKFYYNYTDYKSNNLFISYDYKTEDFATMDLQYNYGYGNCAPIISHNSNYAISALRNSDTGIETLVLINLTDNSSKDILSVNYEAYVTTTIDDEEKYICSATSTDLYLYSVDGTLIWEMPTTGFLASDLHIRNDELYVVTSTGILNRYSLSDGSFISQTEIMVNNASFENKKIWNWDDENSTLIYTYNEVTSIIDTANWYMVSYVYETLGYSPKYDIFCSRTKDKDDTKSYYVGYYKHYTLQDLIDKGNEIIKNTSLTNEEKSLYGIDK